MTPGFGSAAGDVGIEDGGRPRRDRQALAELHDTLDSQRMGLVDRFTG